MFNIRWPIKSGNRIKENILKSKFFIYNQNI